MADNLTSDQRITAMQNVRSKDTSLELIVRRFLWNKGYRGYRLHSRRVIGTPDISWYNKKLAIFVNGCFWHGHDCERGRRVPKTRTEYWLAKIDRNRSRDSLNYRELSEEGWNILKVWECELRSEEWKDQISAFLDTHLKH